MVDVLTSGTGLQKPPQLQSDPYDKETMLNPHLFYEALRETAPVVWLSKYDVYAVGRYDEVKIVMADFERFSTTAGVGLIDRRNPDSDNIRKRNPLTEEDPPIHTRARSGLQKILSPVVVRSWRDRFERKASEIVSRLLEEGQPFDAVTEISQEFVLTVFPESLGMDVSKDYLAAIGEMNFFSLGPMNDLRRASLERMKDALDWYDGAAKRENIRPGSFGEVMYQAEDDGNFDKGVAEGLINLVLRGGTDTTVSGISSTLRYLAENPTQWAIVKNDPSKVRLAFEEAIRLDSPSGALYRVTTRDMEFQGYELKGDTKIVSFLGSANRDPRTWDDPEVFNMTRKTMGQHLAFGTGPHVCIGQMIARLEAEAMLRAIVTRVERIHLTGEPEYRAVSALRSLRSLPMVFVQV